MIRLPLHIIRTREMRFKEHIKEHIHIIRTAIRGKHRIIIAMVLCLFCLSVAQSKQRKAQKPRKTTEKDSRVYLIHRRDSFRGEAKLVEALKAKNNVEFVLDSRITALHGDGELTGITVTDKDGNERDIAVDGLFVAVGHAPDNGIFAHLFDLDEGGYAASDERCLTKTPGVFVAGDCRRKSVRQLTTAVADGSAAALAACGYIDSL